MFDGAVIRHLNASFVALIQALNIRCYWTKQLMELKIEFTTLNLAHNRFWHFLLDFKRFDDRIAMIRIIFQSGAKS